jgi:glycosyltransferase involved in cell wall biosynthesis
MKIVYIATSNIPSRTANSIHVMKMCHAYACLGHDVTLLVPKWRRGTEEGVKDLFKFYGVRDNFRILRVPKPPGKRLDMIYFGLMLPLLALRSKPEIVHSRGLTSAWGTTRLLRQPTLFELHDTPEKNVRRYGLFKQIIQSTSLQALVVITQSLADHLQPLLPSTVKTVVAPDGVDRAWLEQSLEKEQARQQLGIKANKQRIAVYTGHLYAGRGVDLIVELASRLSDHLFILVGGRNSDVEHYRRSTEHMGNIQFVGFKAPSEMHTYLQAADILLMPYANRIHVSGGGDTAKFASPLKMFEYMAAGRPILASTLPVLQEVLHDGINAMLLPYDDPNAWCDTLRHLQQEPECGDKLGMQAQLDAQQYTWEARARKLLAHVSL